jgi:hypothetical protein
MDVEQIAPQDEFDALADAVNEAARLAAARVIDDYNGPLDFQVQIVSGCAGLMTAAGALAGMGDRLGMNMDALAAVATEQFNEGRKGMRHAAH